VGHPHPQEEAEVQEAEAVEEGEEAEGVTADDEGDEADVGDDFAEDVPGAMVLDTFKTVEEFKALTAGGRWLIKFYAPWCRHCQVRKEPCGGGFFS